MVRSVMRCQRMLGRNPWTNITFSAHHLFLYLWKHFGLWEFHNKIHALPRERKMSLCSHFSLCQLRHRKSEAGKMGREKTKEEEVFGKGGMQKTPPPQSMEGEGGGGLSPKPGPFRPRPGSRSPGLSLSARCPPPTPHGSVLTNPHVLPALSLLTHSFSLRPYTGRAAWSKFQPLCYVYAELSRTSSSGLS